MLDQQVGDNHAQVGGEKSPFFLFDVEPILDRLDDRGIGARSADVLLLQGLDQSRLAVSGRRLGEMLGGVERVQIERLPHGERRQQLVLDFSSRRPDFAVTVELEHLALGLEQPRAGGDTHVGHGEDGGCHLAGDESCVDQLVEPELVVAEMALDPLGRQIQFGGPDGLVSFLRVLAGGIANRLGRQVLLSVLGRDQVTHRLHRFLRDAKAVSSHVGDQSDRPGAIHVDPLVELLRDLHGSLAGEPHADRRLLLQGAGLERRIRLVGLVGLIDSRDEITGRGQLVADPACIGLDTYRELGAVVFGQRGLKLVGVGLGRGRADRRGNLPELFGDKGPDLAFAVHDQPDGHRLDAAGAEVACYLAPEQRAELIAYESVEEPASLLGVDHIHVDWPNMPKGLLDRAFGDFMKGDTAYPIVGKAEGLLQVPGDGLALAVRVGRQIDDVGPGGLALQVAHGFFLGRNDFIGGRVTMRHVQAELSLGKIADMTHTRLDNVLGAQELVDRPGLLGTFDNDQRVASAAACRYLALPGLRAQALGRAG